MPTIFEKPNYTQTPNAFFDEIAPNLKEGELRIMLVLIRQTYGWMKPWDRISISQLMKKSGMERKAVCNAVKSLEEKNLLFRKKIANENYFSLCYVAEDQKPDNEKKNDSNNFKQYPKDTTTSIPKIPDAQYPKDTHKTNGSTKDTTTTEREKTPPVGGCGGLSHLEQNRKIYDEIKKLAGKEVEKLYIYRKKDLACDYTRNLELSMHMPPADFERKMMEAYNILFDEVPYGEV
jgi:phage replication O-like protein O